MEEIVLVDTNIFVDFYKGVDKVVDELKLIGETKIATSVIVVSELVYGAFNKQELEQILRGLSSVSILPLNEAIGKHHLELMTKFSLSHNLSLPDALIASTAIYNDIALFTFNTKDFHYLPELQMYKPRWEN